MVLPMIAVRSYMICACFCLMCQNGFSQKIKVSETECGVIAAFIAVKTLSSDKLSYTEFLASCGRSGVLGYTLDQLEIAIKRQSLHTLGLETSVEQLRDRAKRQKFLAIVRLDGNHFVLVTSLRGSSIEFVDFPKSSGMREADFVSRWTDKKALLIATDEIPLSYSSRFGFVWVGGAIMATALLSVLLLKRLAK